MRNLLLFPTLLLTVAVPGFGDVLTFSGNICSTSFDGSGALSSCPNGSYINQSYADSAVVNFTYGASNINGAASLQLWSDPNVYSDLPKAAYGFSFSTDGFIQMDALNGATVSLLSFALGTTPPTFQRTASVRVIDLATNTPVFALSNVSVGGPTATAFSPNVSSTAGLRLEFSGDLFNTGVGNFNYSAVVVPTGAVPEPSQAGLIAVGLAAGAWVRRRRGEERK